MCVGTHNIGGGDALTTMKDTWRFCLPVRCGCSVVEAAAAAGPSSGLTQNTGRETRTLVVLY